MSKQREFSGLTKKHLARAQRERRQRIGIVVGTALTGALVLGLVGYAVFEQTYLKPRRPVATVNGEAISARQFRARVLLTLGSLTDAQTYGAQVLDRMIDDILIRSEANARGVTVGEEEVEERLAMSFGFFPGGTPTPAASPTLDLTEQAFLPATETPTASPTATQGPSPTPAGTATPYTQQAFEAVIQEAVVGLGVRKSDIRDYFRSQLYREKLAETFEPEVPRETDQARVRQLVVETEDAAKAALQRVQAGESWQILAAELSTDSRTKNRAGYLGWVAPGEMGDAFDTAIALAKVGDVVGPFQAEDAWYVVEVLDRQVRPLGDYEYLLAVSEAMQSWLNFKRIESSITIEEDWAASLTP